MHRTQGEVDLRSQKSLLTSIATLVTPARRSYRSQIGRGALPHDPLQDTHGSDGAWPLIVNAFQVAPGVARGKDISAYRRGRYPRSQKAQWPQPLN